MGMLLIVFAHLCDLVSTYLASPDLSGEVGQGYVALASWGFRGWPAIFAIKLAAVTLSLGLFWLYVRTRREFYPREPGMDFHHFLHATHSYRAVRRADGSWVMPSPKLLGIWACFTVAIGSAAFAFFLAMHNMLDTPLLTLGAQSVVPGIIFLVTAVLFWYSLYRDYERVSLVE